MTALQDKVVLITGMQIARLVGSIIYADLYGSIKNQISGIEPYADQESLLIRILDQYRKFTFNRSV